MKTTKIDPITKVQELGEASTETVKSNSIKIGNETEMNAVVQQYKDSDDDFGPF
jgi:hypothetical protein